jgi:hypothetical protein
VRRAVHSSAISLAIFGCWSRWHTSSFDDHLIVLIYSKGLLLSVTAWIYSRWNSRLQLLCARGDVQFSKLESVRRSFLWWRKLTPILTFNDLEFSELFYLRRRDGQVTGDH